MARMIDNMMDTHRGQFVSKGKFKRTKINNFNHFLFQFYRTFERLNLFTRHYLPTMAFDQTTPAWNLS